ncbi:MAG: putative Calcium-chelating exported protein [Sedimentibacter sp.]|jgi:uncharacterized YkwD family protein|nr:putative Calcium-chelating exported protein [Sedimentibacter sp.]
MKNKIIALALGTILAMSSATAFAADVNTIYTNNLNFDELLKNHNIDLEQFNTCTQPVTKAQPVETVKYAETQPAVQATKTTQAAQTAQAETKAATTAKTVSPTANVSFEEKVAQLVNIEREKNGLQPLTFDSSISNVARTKSKDMADNNYFAHQSPTYGSAGDMLSNFGIKWSAWGENIASGQDTPEEVVNAWMNSEGHRANILSQNFGKIGVGYVTNTSGTPYWTQLFTN